MYAKNIIKLVVKTLEDHKGLNVTALDVKSITDLTEAMIICTAQSSRHAKTLADKANLTANADSIKLLVDLTEGNLLAADQAIEKLRMLFPKSSITVTQVQTALSDNARFKIFDLTHHVLQGNANKVLRILDSLRAEGEEIILILWLLAKEIRQLITLRTKLDAGTPMEQVISNEWQTRKPLVKQALIRNNTKTLNNLLQRASIIDQIIKGVKPGNSWEEIFKLSLALAGNQ